MQDVVAPLVCTVLTPEGRLLDEVKQRYLETLVPKVPGAAILAVAGRHRGRRGKLLEVRGCLCVFLFFFL